jgi:hypothetical protein
MLFKIVNKNDAVAHPHIDYFSLNTMTIAAGAAFSRRTLEISVPVL